MESSTENLKQSPRIGIHFNVHEPVELVELTLAFQGLGNEYSSYLKKVRNTSGEFGSDAENHKDVKLYITKIESNCILAEIAPALPLLGSLAPVFSDINSVYDFVKSVGDVIKWLMSKSESQNINPSDIPYTKKNLDSIKDIVHVVADNDKSNLGLKAIQYEESKGGDTVSLSIDFSSDDCSQAERGALKAIRALEKRERADEEKVLMYFHQTNRDDPKTGGRTGDKAVISSVSNKPLSVYIISELDRQMVKRELDDKLHNPLHTGFVVDVNVEHSPNGTPKIYRVMKVHDVVYED